ncbi:MULTISPECIES: hypothetical protein [unclassified Paenibacillus]|uniref:hypothetical protein n=1 Tax=unclassified Paenibacillus TaxID=185978 RepID=UPI00070FF827|nr:MULTISPECIES: hypothetical protein [unclassified Paenibacillus]KQX54908.1 hypothetical protein ASD40_33835 [Paenibacillus sp. Root444D2]KRE51453.1 hypothetical protein ASG85_18175 [Paenibacillus sp. Soil724D2]
MEVNLAATFHNKDNLEQAAEVLKLQGVLDIKFDNGVVPSSDQQADSFIQSVDSFAAEPSFALMVSVEKSRYRQAEDTIIKYGGQLH